MAIDFPAAPKYGDKHEPGKGAPKYVWDRRAWKIAPIAPFPPPLLFRIEPNELVVGDPSPVVVNVHGVDFVNASIVLVDGVTMASTFLSSSHLTFSYIIPSVALTAQVQVINPDGQFTGIRLLTVTLTRHELLSLSPSNVGTGSGTVTVTATGNSFTASSKVSVDGTQVATTYVSATSLTFAYTAPAVAAVAQIRVVTGSKVTNALPLTTVLAPILTSIAPTSANSQTAAGQQITITGQNFVDGVTTIYEDGVQQTSNIPITATQCAYLSWCPTPPRTVHISLKNGVAASVNTLPFIWS